MAKGYGEDEQKRIDERKLLEAKLNDKYKFAITKNRITNTDFLNMQEKTIAEKFLKENHIENYIFFGGNGEDSERHILIFYPQKFDKDMVSKNYSKIVSSIRITIPKRIEYDHRIYLSGIMKLGIKREKVGDILVREDGADIIVLNEIAEFLKSNLESLTRFKSSKIDIIPISEVKLTPKKFEEFKIVVSSMRLDSFVSKLANTSRNKAIEIINEQRVQVNYELELKFSRKIDIGDVITIRGKGKFIIDELLYTTKNEKFAINIKKFI